MALSLREKSKILADIDTQATSLKTATKLREKSNILKNIDDLLAKLTGKAAETVENLFQQIANGIHDTLGAMGLFAKLKEEVLRLGEGIIAFDNTLNDSLKQACVKVAELAETEGLLV